MNKLISKNPVLRFKLGRKIVKALNSWGKDFGTEYIPPVNVTEVPKDWSYSVNQGTANSWHMDKDIVQHDFRPYDSNENLNYPHSGFVSDAYNDLYDTLLRALQIATHNIKKASEPFRRRSYNNSVMDPERSYKAENKRYIANVELPKQKIQTKNKKSVTSSFKNAFNKARAKNLLEFIWNGKRYNTMKAGETKELWLANIKAPLAAQKVDLSLITKPLVPVIAPEIDTPIIPKISSRGGNFNKSLIRDLIKNGGLNPYNYTGAQRRALRMYLNGESDDTSLLDGTDLARFTIPYRKNGGILPSRNIIERFKSKINKN